MGSDLCFKQIPLAAVLRMGCREARAEDRVLWGAVVQGEDDIVIMCLTTRGSEKGLEVVHFSGTSIGGRYEEEKLRIRPAVWGGVGCILRLGAWL